MKAQLQVIKGAMQALANGSATGALESLGILPSDLQTTLGGNPWQANERHLVTKTLDILMYGTMDLLGLPRFQVPAEYVAATIAMFVQPSNLMVACRWMEAGQPTVDYLGNPTVSTSNQEPVESTQLFALCLQVVNDLDIPKFKRQFESRISMSINTAEGDKNHGNEKKIQKIS